MNYVTKQQQLLFPQKTLEKIREQAQKSQKEIVGVLFGKKEKVESIKFLKNISHSRTRFKVDPEQLYKAIQTAETSSKELIGFFHSHPAPPQPSKVDLQFMELWPNAYWIIVDARTGEYAAWQYKKKKIKITLIQEEPTTKGLVN